MQPRLKEGGCIAGLTIIPVSSCSWLQISPTEIGTVGALDLGGASTQITTPLPRSATDNGHAGTISIPLPSRRGKRESRVFSHSHLGFGNKQVPPGVPLVSTSVCGGGGAWEGWVRAETYLLLTCRPAFYNLDHRVPLAVGNGCAHRY